MVKEPKSVVALGDNQRYRELASKLRRLARQSRLPAIEQKILNLALRFEAEPITSTRQGPAKDFTEDAC
jgi:hypothetical protein